MADATSQYDWDGLIDKADNELHRQMKLDGARLFGDTPPFQSAITPAKQRDLIGHLLDPASTPAQRSFAQDVIAKQMQRTQQQRDQEIADG